MSDNTGIEWADATWNPLVGCTKVSPGCDNCYALGVVNRWNAAGNPAFPNTFDVVTMRDMKMLTQPIRWAKPRKVFVNSLSDLFHKDVPDEFIALVFAVMAATPRHTFQLLTKRHGRMRSLLSREVFRGQIIEATRLLQDQMPAVNLPLPTDWPLPNLWLGVSVEDQHWADLRIPTLLQTPAAVRWISAEPLLGPVDLASGGLLARDEFGRGLDWVVVGGESGAGARPMHPDWARSLLDQCAEAHVPFLFKQWGSWAPSNPTSTHLLKVDGTLVERKAVLSREHGRDYDLVDRGHPGWVRMSRGNKKTLGRELDGRTWDEYPEVAHA